MSIRDGLVFVSILQRSTCLADKANWLGFIVLGLFNTFDRY